MAASEKKLQSFYAFNSGEYSKDLAGRTDLESFGSSTRYCCNFLSQVSGGLKKFYGTRHITEQTLEEGHSKVKLIPFINKYEPMVLVVYGCDDNFNSDQSLKIGLVYGNQYKDLDIQLPSLINVDELRWKQINDRLILAHRSVQPLSIDFYGEGDDGEYVFRTGSVDFNEVPYFPVGTTDDYNGPLQASGLTGTITLTIPATSNVAAYFPSLIIGTSAYTRSYYDGSHYNDNFTINNSTVSVFRIRSGQTTTLVNSVVCNVPWIWRHHGGSKIEMTDTISQEKILQAIRTVYPKAYIDGTKVRLSGISDHQDGDQYYMRLNVGSATKWNSASQQTTTIWESAVYTSETFTPQPITTESIDAIKTIGRKMKFFFNDDTQVSPWWQGKTVAVGDYAYSNGHWYKAMNAGNCGNVQPSHTSGTHTDGVVAWKYVHSGSTTARVISVPDSSSIVIQTDDGQELPNNTGLVFNVYSWSIWGKDGVHPSDVYMVGNRLGFVCNTKNYGAWNAMSVTDDYFNFSTEEYGEQLDTSAIVHLIGNNESSDINWVLARKDVYMGGYSGEYHLTPSAQGNRTGAYTPTTTYVQNISNMGSKAVIPLRYKELNLFVGLTGKELYTIGYDYTIDDYTPKSLGYLTQHIMDRGIKRIEALNNLDRNIYLLHNTWQLSLFNYAAEQKVMGFTELNFGDDVVDFCSTYARSEVAGYVVTKRNDGKITIERFAIQEPNYMFDEITQGDGTLADFAPVPHFANKQVWIKCYRQVTTNVRSGVLDANGNVTTIGMFDYRRVSDDSVMQAQKVDWHNVTDFIEIQPNTTYDFSVQMSGDYYSTSHRVYVYDSGHNFIECLNPYDTYGYSTKQQALDGGYTLSLTTPANAAYIRIYYFNKDIPSLVDAQTQEFVKIFETTSTEQFIKAQLDGSGDISHDKTTGVYLPRSEYFKIGLPMVAEMHTQPAFGNKVEGHQQQSLSMYMRIVNSGAFEYGSSVDFSKYFKHEYWNTQQEYMTAHRLFTGDMKLEIPLGYAEAANQGEGPYPNTSAVGINIKSDTPEPLNILSIQEIYK